MDFNSVTLRDYIISNIPQEEILAFFLSRGARTVTKEEIYYAVINKHAICNPLRVDVNPSLHFYYHKDKLKCKDFVNPIYSGDIFDIGKLALGRDTEVSFIDVCKVIINNIKPRKTKKIVSDDIKAKSSFKITVYPRDWSSLDYDYWNIPSDFLDSQNVIPIGAYSFNEGDYITLNINKPTDLAYAYYVIKDEYNLPLYKLYFPNRSKDNKFRNNNNFPLDDFLAGSGKDLIFIKSKKDKVTAKYLTSSNDIEIAILPLSSEVMILDSKYIDFYRSKYQNLYVWLDYDDAGCRNAFVYYKLYNITPIFIGRDISNITFGKETSDFLFDYSSKYSLDLQMDEYYDFVSNNQGDYKTKDLFDLYKDNPVKAINFLKNIIT